MGWMNGTMSTTYKPTHTHTHRIAVKSSRRCTGEAVNNNKKTEKRDTYRQHAEENPTRTNEKKNEKRVSRRRKAEKGNAYAEEIERLLFSSFLCRARTQVNRLHEKREHAREREKKEQRGRYSRSTHRAAQRGTPAWMEKQPCTRTVDFPLRTATSVVRRHPLGSTKSTTRPPFCLSAGTHTHTNTQTNPHRHRKGTRKARVDVKDFSRRWRGESRGNEESKKERRRKAAGTQTIGGHRGTIKRKWKDRVSVGGGGIRTKRKGIPNEQSPAHTQSKWWCEEALGGPASC